MNGQLRTLGDALDRLYQVLPPEARAEMDAQNRKELELAAMLRTNCIDALECITHAMRNPRLSHSDLTDAIDLLTVALDCAKALDN